MALTDEIFQKHLNTAKKPFRKQYNHFRPFDDPDHKSKEHPIDSSIKSNESVDVYSKPDTEIQKNLTNQLTSENNETQTEHKPSTNQTQTRHNSNTKATESVLNVDSIRTQYIHKLVTKPNTNTVSNQTQIINKLNIHAVVGNQRKLLFYLYDLCRIQGIKTTPPLNIESIYENSGVEKGSIKTSLIRLIQKKFLIREEIKNGRAGWVIFKIPDDVYQELFNNDISLSLTQTRHKLNTESNTKLDTSNYIVSSSNINTTTISEDFRKIDCSPLSVIGFDESHIIQIYREYMLKPEISLATEIIQNSINALAFDLKYNNVANSFKMSPAVVLTSMLKKGQPYSSKTPEKVLSPQEEAMREYILAEEKKRNYILEMETKMKNLALQEWLNSLPEEELLNFNDDSNLKPQGMPEKLYQLSKRKKALINAKEYFDKLIWSKKLKEILNKEQAI